MKKLFLAVCIFCASASIMPAATYEKTTLTFGVSYDENKTYPIPRTPVKRPTAYISGHTLYMNIYNNPLKVIWNSPKALEICTSNQIDKRKTDSPCKHCKVLDICRKSINRRVCFVDISKTMGNGYSDYPDPRCPNSTVTGYIL